VDLSDAVATLEYLFLGEAEPSCLASADVTEDGRIDLSDPIRTLAWLYGDVPPPSAPWPVACARSPSEVPCRDYPLCG